MNLYKNGDELLSSIKEVIQLQENGKEVSVLNQDKLRKEIIDVLIYNALFNSNKEIIQACVWLIRASALAVGVFPSSIQSVYEAMGEGKLKGFTTPAINIRTFTYNFARSILRAAQKKDASPVIFEIAKSEIAYTQQEPSEYAANIIAAAIKENYQGPLYIQGDHFQVSAAKFAKDPEGQINEIKKLIEAAIAAGFYNIDIDTSTLVDLSKPTLTEQQRLNFELGAIFTEHVRKFEPIGVTVSVGGEIGEVGHKNSTVEELVAYMDGYQAELAKRGNYKGPSKISVQTGTSHGGIPLADGTVAKVKLDFATLRELSKVARDKYKMSGAVQHGASTLPDELFDKFPEMETSEIHLATGFQNMIYEHPSFPKSLKEQIYDYLRKECASEKKDGETDEQFIYKTRKKGFGPFKKQMCDLDAKITQPIFDDLQAKFEFFFDKLGTSGRRQEILKYATLDKIIVDAPALLCTAQKKRVVNG